METQTLRRSDREQSDDRHSKRATTNIQQEQQ